jgi:hypothetical protein
MAESETKSGAAKAGAGLGIPSATAKVEKKTTFASALGKPASAIDTRGKFAPLKTFLWVAPLTALIWVYAEREQIDRAEGVRVPVVLVSTSTDRVITVLNSDRYIALDLQGPKASLDELKDILAKGPLEVHVNPEVPYEGDIPIIESITKSDLFKSHAVEVKAARPPMRVKVEPKVARRVPVRARAADKLVGPPPVFEPDSVIVEGPKAAVEALEAKPENLFAEADLSDFKRKGPGSYVQDVPIALPVPGFGDQLTMRQTVRARVTIAPSENTFLSIPIHIQLSGQVVSSDKYRVNAPDALTGVEVAGPPDAIERLKKREFPAAVILDLSKENFDIIQATLDKPHKFKAADYRMPEGVTVVNPEKEINISISRRGA